MTLKDSTPFNVQFVGNQPIFIDTLSFELIEGDNYVWKPYIILSLLKKNKTDYIFYHDAGRIDNISYELTSYPDKVLEHIKKNNLNFFLGQQIPHHGNLSKWTKKDCFQIMQTDNSFFYNKPQIQSTWSIWKYSEESLNFLNNSIEFDKYKLSPSP